ncbi:MAG: hypothetical protein Q7V43_26355 [Myxococcales bacterium]|nr:hypothetical protein [Myxococcales bacterium]
MPNDILNEVRAVLAGLPAGKAPHNHHWVNAYTILARLPPAVRQQLFHERGAPGAGSGNHYSAASFVATACENLSKLGEVEVDFMVPDNATYTIDGHVFQAGYQLCGIYQRK